MDQFETIETSVFDDLQQDLAARAARQTEDQFDPNSFGPLADVSALTSNWVEDRTTRIDPRTRMSYSISLDEADDLDLAERDAAAKRLTELQSGRIGIDTAMIGRDRAGVDLESERIALWKAQREEEIDSDEDEATLGFRSAITDGVSSGLSVADATAQAIEKYPLGVVGNSAWLSEYSKAQQSMFGLMIGEEAGEDIVDAGVQEVKNRSIGLQIAEKELQIKSTTVDDLMAMDQQTRSVKKAQGYQSIFPDVKIQSRVIAMRNKLGSEEDRNRFDAGIITLSDALSTMNSQLAVLESAASDVYESMMLLVRSGAINVEDGIDSKEAAMLATAPGMNKKAAKVSSFVRAHNAITMQKSRIESALDPDALAESMGPDSNPHDLLASLEAGSNLAFTAGKSAEGVFKTLREHEDRDANAEIRDLKNKNIVLEINKNKSELADERYQAAVQMALQDEEEFFVPDREGKKDLYERIDLHALLKASQDPTHRSNQLATRVLQNIREATEQKVRAASGEENYRH